MRDHRASRTAVVVAKSQVLADHSGSDFPHPGHGAVEHSRRVLKLTGNGRFANSSKSPRFRRLLRLYEGIIIPGLARHHVLRKNAIEKKTRDALQSAVQQVIQIGAGFDSLCH